MRVILQTDVNKLGTGGEVVEVADGYARNYLFPRNLAIPATPQALAEVKTREAAVKNREAKELEKYRLVAERLEDKEILIKARAGEGERLFGSVTAKEIALAVKDQLGEEVDRRKIELKEPIKAVGQYRIKIKLHPEVAARVIVKVEAQ